MVTKILLFYCTILGMFMNISGMVAARQPQDYLLQAVFLPITLFLIVTSIKTITTKKSEKKPESAVTKKPITTIVFLSFLLVFAFATRIALSQPREYISPLPELVEVPSIAPTPTTIISQTLTIVTENPKTPVNVREKPASNSAVLAKTKSGAVFSYLDSKEGWYQIKFEDGKQGWVFGEFIITDEVKQ